MRGYPMKRILVVDDEIHVVRLLQKYLASKEYEVYTATSGLDAIQKAKDMMPHIVLLDIIMPGMGGIDTLKEIKKINPKIAVIMVTAVIDEELAKRALQLVLLRQIILQSCEGYVIQPSWKKKPYFSG